MAALANGASLFTATTRFKEATDLINTVDDKKFGLLLKRILEKLHLKREQLFNDTECGQLQAMLKLNGPGLSTILDGCSFIFEKASYETVSPDALSEGLTAVGMSASKAGVFADLWRREGKVVLGRLAETTISGPSVLSSFSWRANMKVGQSGAAKLRDPSVVFDFTTSDPDANNVDTKFAVEFTHDRLYDFFLSLEKIQEQLDALG